MGNAWTIARNTIAQAFRIRVAAVLMAIFMLSAMFLPLLLERDPTGHIIIADGTPAGGIRVLLTWSVTLATALLTVLTVLLSSYALDDEIKKKQIFLVACKPVSRWSILFGKWLGIMVLNGWLMLLMGVVLHVELAWFSQPTIKAPFAARDIAEQVLTSRESIRPDLGSLQIRLMQMMEELKRNADIPDRELHTQVVQSQLDRLAKQKSFRIDPLGMAYFELDGVPAPAQSDTLYTVRYQLHALNDSKPYLRGNWAIHSSDWSRYYLTQTYNKGSDTREFTFPAGVVGADGKLVIEFQNLSVGDPAHPVETYRKSYPVSFGIPDGLEVLAPSGSFLPNLLRGLLLIWLRLAFLAVVGVAGSAFMGYPVTTLLLICVMTYGYGRGFIIGHYEKQQNKPQTQQETELKPGELAGQIGELIVRKASVPASYVVPYLASAFPDFDATDPVPDFVVGRQVTWGRIFSAAFWTTLLRGGLVFLLGGFIFRAVELGVPRT